MKKIFSILVLGVGCWVLVNAQQTTNTQHLTPNTQSPWTFWYWMYGAVSKAGIKADLKCMKDVGLGGCYLMPIRGADERPEYKGEANQLTPKFWEMVDYAFQQADSLGLQMGIHICDGFALAGGPWISPEESMQKVVWSDTIVSGNEGMVMLKRPVPEGKYYEDIAVFAVPVPEMEGMIEYRCDTIATHNTGVPYIGRNESGVFRSDDPCYILLDLEGMRTVRSIKVIPSGNNIQSQRLLVQASDDGITFRDVRQLTPPRQGWQSTGFDFTYSLPETTARYIRLYWSPEGSEPGSEDLDAAKWRANLKLKDVVLYSYPQVDGFEGKSGAVWRIQTAAPGYNDGYSISLKDIIPLQLTGNSVQLAAAGKAYHIYRIGHTTTGHTNATAGGAKGLECDKFSADAVKKQVGGWFDLFMQRPHHDVVKYMHIDSWECGSQNWSPNFAREFQQRRGYDLMPYLMVYAGVPVENAEKVLYDIRLTINDLVNDVFFRTLSAEAHQRGMRLSSESVAPTMVSDGMEHYKLVDIPMGEYWLNSPTHDKPNDMLDAISGAHVYGKNIVQAEGFTEVRGVWDETPASVKTLLDRNFAQGMNRLFFHVNTHNPWTDRRPGMTLDGIGLFFQRDQTWMPEAKDFVSYITRCQKMLQEGRPVADIAVFAGEEMPSRAVLPERLVPMLPGIFGKERVAAEAKRLENNGNPMEESPVGVKHSAGIVDTRDWVNALNGYQYDSMNRDALLNLATATADSCIALPSGAKYRVLVIPQKNLSAEVRNKVESFKKAGVVVIDQPYTEADFSAYGLPRDIVLPKDIAYTHRTVQDAEIYFLSNQVDKKRKFMVKMRENCHIIILYDPLTDRYQGAFDESTSIGTETEITLQPNGSLFVMLIKKGADEFKLSSFGPSDHAKTVLISSPWRILFQSNKVSASTETLYDWSQSGDDRIRYYSGAARYETGFELKTKPNQHVWLNLGQVHDVAHIYVDGTDCGTVWTAPYTVDITHALKNKNEHQLRIVVVNTWANALRGADEGKAPFGGIWTNAKYRMSSKNLLPAGLLGPVELKIDE